MSVLSIADHADMDSFFGQVLTLHLEKAMSTKDAKAHLTKFIDEVDLQNAEAGQNMKDVMTVVSRDDWHA